MKMVEKVARAIHNSDPDGLGALPWDELEDWQTEFYISDARAAIEAMRWPTSDAMCKDDNATRWLGYIESDRYGSEPDVPTRASLVFTAMIDAALNEGKP